MTKMSLWFQPAEMTDALDVLAWRNDAVTRKMSGTNNLISEGEHLEWFEKTIENPKVQILIAFDEHTNTKIGMVRFDLNYNLSRAEISININPEFRSKGFGRQCLIDAADYISIAFPTCGVVDAVVRAKNAASIRAFSSVGYREVARNGNLIHFQLEIE